MTRHASLAHDPSDLIGGSWVALAPARDRAEAKAGEAGGSGEGGEAGGIVSVNPARPGDPPVWTGLPREQHIDLAANAAREALGPWTRWGFDRRAAVLRRYAELCRQRADAIASLICDETGKVMWESAGEAALLAAKVDITLDPSDAGGLARVRGYEIPLGESKLGRCWFRPHGVMAVIGPFNFPAHLPNGHIVPALAMGNTVILKPSDKAPAVGQMLGELFEAALRDSGWDGPGGVVNVVQGAAAVASKLVSHDGIDGILFTGSWPVGRRILGANLDRPSRIVALEMGGNNAAVVLPDADLRQAAIEIVRCAFNTAGQRCTCTRRAVIHRGAADRLIPAICKAASQLVIGDPRADHPVFMGPVISADSRDAVLRFQAEASGRGGGGRVLVEAAAAHSDAGGYYISPGVMQVDRFNAGEEGEGGAGCDREVFGPMLRIAIVDSFDEAIEQANATRYGLAASIFTADRAAATRFLSEARAGCINVNMGTAGASSKLPFGGLGLSGNHRPTGSFALDYCAYPVAGMVERGPEAAIARGMRFDDAWLG